MSMTFKFIDLFAGIGGFHQAMTQLGGECVFASEIDKFAASVYKNNYGIDPLSDITEVDEKDIPKHDVLCAGFPCQAFSVAGSQAGFCDETRGTLFFEIERILKYHHTKYIILENVKNLVRHDKGRTWKVIKEHLHNIGYRLTEEPIILSPHHFGTPQLRERVIILGIYDPMHINEPLHIDVGTLKTKNDNNIYSVLDHTNNISDISEYEESVLNMWNEFYQGIDRDVIGFPIWGSLLISFLAAMFSIYLCLWVVAVCVWVVFASLLVGSLLGYVASFLALITGNTTYAAYIFACSLIASGLTIIFFYLGKLAFKGMGKLTKLMVKGLKRMLIGKGK
mgnify:CR=1 FL=1